MRPVEALDQASGLRRLLGEQNAFQSLGIFGPDPDLNAAAAANLAYALARRGSRVCLLEEAPGPRNAAGLLGLSPRHGLADALEGRLALADALVTGPGGIQVLLAPRGVFQVGAVNERRWARLGDEFRAGGHQWLLATAPLGEVPSLALVAPRRLLVLPAAKTRLTEAYASLKAAHQQQPDADWHLLFMQVADPDKARQLLVALGDTCRRFLGIELSDYAAVPRDARLDAAARAMRPVLDLAPAAPAAQAFRELAEAMEPWTWGGGPSLEEHWQRLGIFSRMVAEAATASNVTAATRRIRHGGAHG